MPPLNVQISESLDKALEHAATEKRIKKKMLVALALEHYLSVSNIVPDQEIDPNDLQRISAHTILDYVFNFGNPDCKSYLIKHLQWQFTDIQNRGGPFFQLRKYPTFAAAIEKLPDLDSINSNLKFLSGISPEIVNETAWLIQTLADCVASGLNGEELSYLSAVLATVRTFCGSKSKNLSNKESAQMKP